MQHKRSSLLPAQSHYYVDCIQKKPHWAAIPLTIIVTFQNHQQRVGLMGHSSAANTIGQTAEFQLVLLPRLLVEP